VTLSKILLQNSEIVKKIIDGHNLYSKYTNQTFFGDKQNNLSKLNIHPKHLN
jgi:hypothetical protein